MGALDEVFIKVLLIYLGLFMVLLSFFFDKNSQADYLLVSIARQ